MKRHGPTTLRGPVSRRRSCWHCLTNGPTTSALDPSIRHELVERVRREIAAGTYDTPEKWEMALERLLDRCPQEED